MRELVEAAVADLAGRLGRDPGAIELVSAEPVTWPDASLGCPLPGMSYRQVPEDGYRIVLRAGEREYAYHGGARLGPFLCTEPGETPGTRRRD